jgi:acetyl esterase/lipase
MHGIAAVVVRVSVRPSNAARRSHAQTTGKTGAAIMSDAAPRHPITLKRTVYHIEYRMTDAGSLTLDVYRPHDSHSSAPLAAVVFVIGYSDVGGQAVLGCKIKDMEAYISWAQLVAASGLTAITYTTGSDPASDVDALLHFVRQNAGSLGVDADRIGVWAASGSVPLALSVLMQRATDHVRCAVLSNGFMLDADGASGVSQAADMWRFVNRSAGKSVDDLPSRLPLFVVRSGHDENPHLNDSIDRFVAKALARNLPITLVNHADAPHAFDVSDDSETSRQIIGQILAFLRFHLIG